MLTTSNRLSGINLTTGGTRAYTYVAAGNVITDSRGAGYSYTYDAAGRMASMSINGVRQGTYKYDFAGRQAIRTIASTGVTIHSVFDSQGRRIAEYNQATGALMREYVWMGWEPIAVIEGGVTSFVRTDYIGRPVFATNTAGTQVWTASYTPFGGVRTTTGTPSPPAFPASGSSFPSLFDADPKPHDLPHLHLQRRKHTCCFSDGSRRSLDPKLPIF